MLKIGAAEPRCCGSPADPRNFSRLRDRTSRSAKNACSTGKIRPFTNLAVGYLGNFDLGEFTMIIGLVAFAFPLGVKALTLRYSNWAGFWKTKIRTEVSRFFRLGLVFRANFFVQRFSHLEHARGDQNA